MGLDKNKIVAIPESGRIGSDNRVFVISQKVYLPDKQYNIDKRISIGKAIDKKTMYPNDNYQKLFPHAYAEETGARPKAAEVSCGLQIAVKSICSYTGLYRLAEKSIGRHTTDLFLDYCMYMMLMHSDVTQHFEKIMDRHLLFSEKLYSDSYYSDAFSKSVTPGQILRFKEFWAEGIKEREGGCVHISIDGSNDDCEAEGIEIAEPGHPKSGKNVDIFNFMYAVTEKGTPVTYDVYRGSVIDAKALKRIITFLQAYGLRPEDYILDRGFCDDACVNILSESHLHFVMMLKGNINACTSIVEAHGNEIKFNVRNKIPGTQLFGITDRFHLFKASREEEYIHLFFDWKNGGERAFKLMEDYEKALASADRALKEGKKLSVPAKFKDIIKLRQGRGPRTLVIDYEKYQKLVNQKGLSAIATSRRMEIQDVSRTYHIRDACEKQYSILKTQIGFDRNRTYSTPSLETRCLVAFLASIIRNEFIQISRQLAEETDDRKHYTANSIIYELSSIRMTLINGIYCFADNLSDRQQKILNALQLDREDIEFAIHAENLRQEGKIARRRRKKPGRKKKTI